MLKPKQKYWIRVALFLLLVGIAFLAIPPYENYCEGSYPEQNYCALYEFAVAIRSYLDSNTVTALATAVVAVFTATIYINNRDQLRFGRKVERAYVFARAVLHPDKYKLIGRNQTVSETFPVNYIEVFLDNHGKTPAYVSKIALSVCLVEELPKPDDLLADYERSDLIANLSIGPSAVDVRTYRRRELGEAAGKIMYGCVFYTDIFGDPHFSRFIYRIHQNGIAAPFETAPEYTAWD